MSRALGVPSLELYTNLPVLGGVGLPIGMSVDADSWTVNESEESAESMVFTTPRQSDAGLHVAEGQIARVCRSDSDYDEWIVGGLKLRRGEDAMATVTCQPLLYRLSVCGLVTDWERDPADGMPPLDWGVQQLTTREILQSKIFDNPDLASLRDWLRLGTIDPEDVLIDVEVSSLSVREVINACLAALAAKVVDGTTYVLRLTRAVDNVYELNIVEQEDVS